MLVTLLGIVTLVNELQPENAEEPMLVTLLGIVTLVNEVQLWKAYSPMLVTLLGIVTLARPPGMATSVFPSFVNKSPDVDL